MKIKMSLRPEVRIRPKSCRSRHAEAQPSKRTVAFCVPVVLWDLCVSWCRCAIHLGKLFCRRKRKQACYFTLNGCFYWFFSKRAKMRNYVWKCEKMQNMAICGDQANTWRTWPNKRPGAYFFLFFIFIFWGRKKQVSINLKLKKSQKCMSICWDSNLHHQFA